LQQQLYQVFFKENVRYLVWTCGDPISLILGTRFSLYPGTRIGSLKHLKKLALLYYTLTAIKLAS